MRVFPFATAAAAIVAAASAAVTTQVYEGPTECGPDDLVAEGKWVSIHYTGSIDETSETGERGKVFDSTFDTKTKTAAAAQGKPLKTFDFQIGSGSVIKGWDKGLMNLCKGSRATMVIPPEDGYGSAGAADIIPPGATLHFDVQVVHVSDKRIGPPQQNLFAKMDSNKDGVLVRKEVLAFFMQREMLEIPKGLWEEEDANGDDVITWEEFRGPKGDVPPARTPEAEAMVGAEKTADTDPPIKKELMKLFDVADTNGDGELDSSELEALRETVRTKLADQPEQLKLALEALTALDHTSSADQEPTAEKEEL